MDSEPIQHCRAPRRTSAQPYSSESSFSASRLLTPLEISRQLGLTPKTLSQWRWRRIGPPFVKLPGRNGVVRYPEDRFLTWLVEELHPERASKTVDELKRTTRSAHE